MVPASRKEEEPPVARISSVRFEPLESGRLRAEVRGPDFSKDNTPFMLENFMQAESFLDFGPLPGSESLAQFRCAVPFLAQVVNFSLVHFARMLGLYLLPTNGFSIKPLKNKLLAGERKATELFFHPDLLELKGLT